MTSVAEEIPVTDNSNFPSISVCVPLVVPLITTVEPMSASLVFESFITPEIVCAKLISEIEINRMKKNLTLKIFSFNFI